MTSSSSSSRSRYLLPTKANLRGKGLLEQMLTGDNDKSGAALNEYQNFLHSQAFDDGQKLAYIAGVRNKGIKFRPDWNSGETARRWLNAKIQAAKNKENKKLQEYYEKWNVLERDMDEDPNTPANVVVYSDYDGQVIKSVDGFYLAPPKRKQALRGYYSNIPDKETRAAYASRPELQKKIKAYFKTYQTPDDWNKYSFDNFRQNEYKSNFQAIRDKVKEYFDKYGFKIYKPPKKGEKDGTGNVLLQNYMPILQKTTSWVQDYLIFDYLKFLKEPLPESIDNYNFASDSFKKLKKKAKARHGQSFYNWLNEYNILDDYLTDDKSKYIANALIKTLPQFNVTITPNGEGKKWTVVDKNIVPYYKNKQTMRDNRLKDIDDYHTFSKEFPVEFVQPKLTNEDAEIIIDRMMREYEENPNNPLLRKKIKNIQRLQELQQSLPASLRGSLGSSLATTLSQLTSTPKSSKSSKLFDILEPSTSTLRETKKKVIKLVSPKKPKPSSSKLSKQAKLAESETETETEMSQEPI
jgi:hypothetical protein